MIGNSFGLGPQIPTGWRPPTMMRAQPQMTAFRPSYARPAGPMNIPTTMTAQWQLQRQNEMLRLQNLKRQDEIRRLSMQQRSWRAMPTTVTNIYQTAPAPITTTQPTVAVAPIPSPEVAVPPSMPAPQPNVSQGTTNDLGPTQDAAAEHAATEQAAAQPQEHPGHSIGRKVIIGLVVVGAGVGGYMLWKRHKKHGSAHASHPHGHAHSGMQGYRRRRRR